VGNADLETAALILQRLRGKVLVFDHAFHGKTRSSFIILKDLGVSIAKRVAIPVPYRAFAAGAGNYDAALFWQAYPSVAAKTACPAFFAPMEDAPGKVRRPFIDSLEGILCFSRPCAGWFSKFRDVGYVQYMPPVAESPRLECHDPLRVLFWYRYKLSAADVACFISKYSGRSTLSVLSRNDYGKELRGLPKLPSRCHATLGRQWYSREKYLELLDWCDVFVAPRKREGIGLAYLEAMARGKLILAWNGSTMNEYIRHWENGLLFRKLPSRINLSDLDRLRRSSFKHARRVRAALESVVRT